MGALVFSARPNAPHQNADPLRKVRMKCGKQAIRMADARKSGFLQVPAYRCLNQGLYHVKMRLRSNFLMVSSYAVITFQLSNFVFILFWTQRERGCHG